MPRFIVGGPLLCFHVYILPSPGTWDLLIIIVNQQEARIQPTLGGICVVTVMVSNTATVQLNEIFVAITITMISTVRGLFYLQMPS